MYNYSNFKYDVTTLQRAHQKQIEIEKERKSEEVMPVSNYRDKYVHLIGQEAALEAARKTETNKSYGFGTDSIIVFSFYLFIFYLYPQCLVKIKKTVEPSSRQCPTFARRNVLKFRRRNQDKSTGALMMTTMATTMHQRIKRTKQSLNFFLKIIIMLIILLHIP